MMAKTTSNGTTASYYELPKGSSELQDLIMSRNMNGQDAECFRALYRKGEVSHSSMERDTRKIIFYQTEELCRLQGIDPEEMPELRDMLRAFLNEIQRTSEKQTSLVL